MSTDDIEHCMFSYFVAPSMLAVIGLELRGVAMLGGYMQWLDPQTVDALEHGTMLLFIPFVAVVAVTVAFVALALDFAFVMGIVLFVAIMSDAIQELRDRFK